MRLHDIERRVLAMVAVVAVPLVLLYVAVWMWGFVRLDADDVPSGLVATGFALAAVILVASWPVLHVAIATARGRGTRPREPGPWIAVFAGAVVLWSGVLFYPLFLLAVGAFALLFVLAALLAARRLALRRRARG